MSTTDAVVRSDVPSGLMELLYLREVWALPQTDRIPRFAVPPIPPERLPAPSSAGEWLSAWEDTIDQLRAGSEDGLIPTWRRTHGLAGINVDHLQSWLDSNRRAVRQEHLRQATNRETFEALRSAHALVTPHGFRSEFILPDVEHFHMWLSPERLLVAQMTRFEPGAYELALLNHPAIR